MPVTARLGQKFFRHLLNNYSTFYTNFRAFSQRRVSGFKMRRLFFLIVILSFVGCTPLPQVDATLSPEATPTPTVSPPLQTEEPDSPQSGTVTIRIWIPPEFDPTNGSLEGEHLQARLDEFTDRRSNVRIETRIKDVEGPGGIIDTLSTAGAAAPLALPDLVALPHHSLENAAIKGLLHPFDGLTSTMDDPDWYEYARQLSHLQNSTFGIPFAGDALILVYRPSIIGNKPTDWASTLEASAESSASLSFPAADPNGLIPLALYQSTGGPILDEENRPTLNTIQLTEVLTYFRQAQLSSLMPFWLTQYETDEQSWTAYEDNQTEMVITWASRYLQNPPVDSAGAPIPTPDGIPFTLATGWAWALVSPDPDRQAISAQLAEFLSTGAFLADWTAAGGYIPPRPSALSAWENVSIQTLLNQVAPSARLMPSLDVITALGPVLQKATVDILKEQADPVTAAEAAADVLASP
jgi:ABC-type glycerol-3-phosphate transport system substrate-binding protein